MLGQLVVLAGPDQGRVFSLQEGEPFLIGRGQDTATRLKDPQISPIHCQNKVEGSKTLLINSSTKSPTLLVNSTGALLRPSNGINDGDKFWEFIYNENFGNWDADPTKGDRTIYNVFYVKHGRYGQAAYDPTVAHARISRFDDCVHRFLLESFEAAFALQLFQVERFKSAVGRETCAPFLFS